MKHASKEKGDTSFKTGFELGYVYRRTEEELNAIAAKTGGEVSGPQLARGLGELLLSKTSGQGLGFTHSMPGLRGKTTRVGKIMEQVEMGDRTQRDDAPIGKRHLSVQARKRIAKAQRERWRKYKAEQKATAKKTDKRSAGSGIKAWWGKHSKRQRDAIMARRMKVRKANAKHAA